MHHAEMYWPCCKKPRREKISLCGLRQGDTLNPIYLATETSWKLEVSDEGNEVIMLSRK